MLGAILIAAGALRLSDLGRESAWIDEVLSLSFSTGSLTSITRRLEPLHLPVFFWLSAPLVAQGSGEGWVRLLPAAFGVALVPVAFGIGVELGRVRVGLTAAALVAVSRYLIGYSQEFRMYALVAFFGLVGTWAVLRLRRGPGRRLAWAVLGLASLLNLYTSPFAIFIVAIHWGAVAALAWRQRALLRPFLAFALLLAISYVPALLHMRPLFTRPASAGQGGHEDYESLALLAGISLNHFAGLVPALAVLLAFGSLLGAVVAWRQCRAFVLIAGASFAVPLVSLHLAKSGHFFNPRYLIYAQPHLVLLASLATVWLWDRAARRFASRASCLDVLGPAAAGVGLVIALTQMTAGHELIGRKADWRSVARTLLADLHDGDLVVIEPFFENNTLLYHMDRLSPAGGRVRLTPRSDACWYGMYHRKARFEETPRAFLGPRITMVGIADAGQLDRLPAVEGATWLVASDELPEAHARDFQLVLRVAPTRPFYENAPQADSRRALALYRRERRSASRRIRGPGTTRGRRPGGRG